MSIMRFCWFLCKLGLLTAAIVLAMQYQTTIDISAGSYVLSISSLTLSIGLALLLLVLVYVTRIYLWLVTLPARMRRVREEQRRAKGYRALTKGMVAVAAGEKLVARESARRAEALLQEPPLTMLLSAQSAQLEGDELAAKRYFQQMLDEPEMAFLGMRGLIMQALKQQNLREAQKLLQQAEARFPKQAWISAQHLQLQERLGNHVQAIKLIDQAKKLGALSAQEADDKFIHLQHDMAQEAFAAQRLAEAKEASEAAWKRLQRQANPKGHALFAPLQLLMWRIACAQQRYPEADRAWVEVMVSSGAATVLAMLDQRLDSEGLRGLSRWKKQKALLEEQATQVAVACYLCHAALAVELIGEAEQALRRVVHQEESSTGRDYAEAQWALAQAKQDDKAMAHWQRQAMAAK